jgi:glycosyltransferase involved in cell wall biosynthesis
VVHLHTLPYPHNSFALRSARRAGKKVILTPHFHPGHQDYERPHQFRWLRRADAVVVISAHEKEALAARGVPASKITVTGCGVAAPIAGADEGRTARRDLRTRLGLGAATQIVVCVARKTPEKGIATLLDATTALLAAGRDVALVLAGPPFAWFAERLASLPPSVQQRIFDLGVLAEEDKRAVLAGADLFAMPSRHEAFGIVFLEAWAAGLPVVGGADGAQPEVIGAGGLTVPFGDAPATAGAMAHFLDRPDAAGQAVAAGRHAITERFNWNSIGDQEARQTAY